MKAATLENFEWNRNATMDELLQTIANKAGDDEVLLSFDMKKYGTHTLQYYLENNRRTQITFNHDTDKVTVRYSVYEEIGTTSNNITDTVAGRSYAEMDYSLMVPTLKTVDHTDRMDGDELVYTISRGASSRYPGIAFIIDNIPVRMRWDMSTKKMNFYTKGIQKGYVIPFTLEDPASDDGKLNILRALDNFVIKPSHWVNDGSGNENLETIELPPETPSDTKPGSKPGLTITFDRPMIFNEGTKTYGVAGNTAFETSGVPTKAIITLEDIRNIGETTDIIFDFNAVTTQISTAPTATNSNANARVRYDSGKYTIELVKDRTDLDTLNALPADQAFLEWNELEASRVYIASINLQDMDNFEFHDYEPENEYAYTYIDYEVKRASMDDAYLDIAPYAGSNSDDLEYTIFHKKADANFTDDNIWLKHYHNQTSADTNIYIPVPFQNGSTQEFYQVGIQFAGTKLKSQTIHYKPVSDTNVPPPVPKIKAMKNLAVVPPDDVTSNEPTIVQFDLEWYAPSKNLLDTMLTTDTDAIYYEFLMNDIPQSEPDNDYQILKVFKVWKDTDGIKVVEVGTGKDVGTPTDSIGSYNAFGYNERDGLFEVQNIILKDSDGWSKPAKKDLTTDPFYTPADPTTDSYNYEFPGINFVRMRSVYMNSTGGIGESDRSVADSLSLSMLKHDIPMVDNLTYIPRIDGTKVGMNIKFKLINPSNYENFMLAPISKTITDIDYRVFISQNKNDILNIDNLLSKDDPANIMKLLDLDDTRLVDPLNKVTKIDIATDTKELTPALMEKLRADEMLYYDINKGPSDAGYEELKLLNLDPNTNYYVRVVTKLNIKHTVDLTTETRRSDPSSMLSTTSPVVPSNPGENELIPLAPENMEAKYFDDNRLTGEISFTYPNEVEFAKDKYGFELFVIENKALPTGLEKVISMKEIMESTPLSGINMEAWRLIVGASGYELKYYNKSTDTWDNTTAFTYKVEDNKITIIDNNNLPNKVYYYYARTIKVQGDQAKGASAWIGDTLTTAPIKSPINLMVTHTSSYSFDAKVESIIRFDAPVPSDFHTTGNYIMEVFVKADKDTDYTNNKYGYTYLGQEAGAKDGYTRMYYKISGLKPGTTYSIKVRVEDRTMPMETLPNGSKVYPVSSFSERVSTRTEFDQVDYDKEVKYLEYIQYYLDKAEELKNTPLWLVEETDKKKVIKYREEMNIGELKFASEGKYYVEGAIEGVTQIYIPADMIEVANNKSITLMMTFPEGEFGIRPYAISEDDTKEIKDMVTKINQYNNATRDYYVRVETNFGQYNDKVKGYKPVTKLINMDFQVVGSTKSEEDFDHLALKKLEDTINSKKSYLIAQLEKELESGIDESKLLKIVQDTLKLVKDTHRASVASLMKQYIVKDYVSLETLSNDIRIAFNTKSQVDALQGYRKEKSTWQPVDGYYYNNQYTMDTKKPGAYLLAPRSSMYNQLDDAYNGKVTTLVNQYKLTEVFNSGELGKSDSKVYTYQIVSATSRVLGATNGYDNQEWLTNMGIQVPEVSPYGYMKKEEALYLFMQAYSKKNNIPLETMSIKDYNLIEDSSSIDAAYRDALLRGANYGIIPLVDGQIMPQDDTTIETVLEMLTRIDNKIDW